MLHPGRNESNMKIEYGPVVIMLLSATPAPFLHCALAESSYEDETK